jgi:ABC-2 type transport system ATP-binding protein
VQRVAVDGDRVSLQATGELAPLLRVISEHDPVDLVTRHADLDELFLTYYRDAPSTDAD